MVQPLWKTVWRLLRKLKVELPYDLAILLLSIYPDKTTIQKDTHMPMFTVALFTTAQTWKQPKCASTDEWIKRCGVYIFIYIVEYYSAIKKNRIMPFAAIWMQPEVIILSDIHQKENYKYYDITCMWNLKYDTNEPIYEAENNHRHRKQSGGCQG